MTNKQLLMFAAAGLLAPLAISGVANAEIHGPQITTMIPAPKLDLAPVTTVKNATTGETTTRLKRTDQEQPGNEMTAFTLLNDGKTGFFAAMTSELNSVGANDRIQLSLTKFTLTQAADGSVSAVADTANAKFITANQGNERRNANAPTAMTINNGSVACFRYNYQPNGTNDTVRYVQCVNADGATVLPQTKAYAKQNDDCSMHQDGDPGVVVGFTQATNTTRMVEWAGCNGNGQDKGWAFVTNIACDSATAPTKCTFSNEFDIALAQREERSRGKCSVDANDNSYAVCSWTEGNNQPQRDGVWLAAIALDKNLKGADQQAALLWKKMIAGKATDAATNITTYAQRATHERVMAINAQGVLAPTNTIFYRWGDASGNNNTNEGKGGTYRTTPVAVIQVSKTGMTYTAPAVDMQMKLHSIGGTHLGAAAAMFGADGAMQPGLVFLNGSHNGGGGASQMEPVGFDSTSAALTDLGQQEVASHDRHLYSNYLGNNPGNQGRNHSQMTMVTNPYAGMNGNTDKILLLTATSGKAAADMDNAAIKLTAFMTVSGIASTSTATTTGTGGTGGTGTGGTGTGGTGDGSSDPGTTLGGCNAGGSSGGLATFFLIGLAAFIRRRR